jgi:replicative DNA helicase
MRWALAAKTASTADEKHKANAELLRVKGDLEIIIGKNRNGEQGAVTLWHSMAHNAVRDLRAPAMEEVG